MADLIRDITPGAFAPSRRSRRRDDENASEGDFARWMTGGIALNDDAPPARPLTQRPMTSMEDLILLARAREQISLARIAGMPNAYESAYEQAEALEAPPEQDENQYTFDFMSPTYSRVDERI